MTADLVSTTEKSVHEGPEVGADDSEPGQQRLVTRPQSQPNRSRQLTTRSTRLMARSTSIADPHPTTAESDVPTADPV
jgi:hypothetical protein